MTTPKKPAKKKRETGFVVGRAGFEKISAVEGIRLTTAMKKRAAISESKGLTEEESRDLIIQAYRKG